VSEKERGKEREREGGKKRGESVSTPSRERGEREGRGSE
jgi:hypothetical protein